tara:strand:+ start:360 stop:884 length:525 start_codon:yes stop_codon:yes gene_type:complete
MSEENTQVATEAVSEETTQEASTSSTDVGALVAESKKYRKRSQDAETRLAKLESQLANAEKAKLKEKEDFKALYEENEAKIESLTNNADKWSKYETDKREALLNGVPEDERESLSKLDFETLEYITNKINNMKPNIPQVVGNSRTVPPQKKLSEMTDSEKRDNWQSIINSHKRK